MCSTERRYEKDDADEASGPNRSSDWEEGEEVKEGENEDAKKENFLIYQELTEEVKALKSDYDRLSLQNSTLKDSLNLQYF